MVELYRNIGLWEGNFVQITCISAANTKLIGDNSTSIKVCNLINDIIKKNNSIDVTVKIIPLVNYDIKPCILCGKCYSNSKCIYDEAFNELYDNICKSDGFFFVVPHYSPVPSKLLMVFEKINEIIYAGWINNPNIKIPFAGKPVGIIGHGGAQGSETVLKYYHDNLVTPVARTLESLSFEIVGVNEDFPKGAVFGLKDGNCIRKVQNSIFPEIIEDWTLIQERITPLIKNVIEKLSYINRNKDF